MNVQPQTKTRMTPEKYLEFERTSEHRHEYYDEEYILVSQNSYLVERYVRSDEGSWRYFSYENMEHTMEIESVKCNLLLSDIYYRVKFQDS